MGCLVLGARDYFSWEPQCLEVIHPAVPTACSQMQLGVCDGGARNPRPHNPKP